MIKTIKRLSVFFFWLSWVVMTAHMIIPHDHHFAESVNSKGESCPLADGKSGHPSGFPVHCHVLNDLTSERISSFILRNQVQNKDISFSDNTDIIVHKNITTVITIFENSNSFPDSHILELSFLRAPPSFV
jgi:hypothetical protein